MNLKTITWNRASYQTFLNYLQSLKEEAYQKFNERLIFTKYPILGIRLPHLRKIAKEILTGDYQTYLKLNTDTYYEEILLKGLVIASLKNKEELFLYFNSYLNLLDNWAFVDTFCNSLKIVGKNQEAFLPAIKELVASSKTYTIRTGLVLLLNYYVEERYLPFIFTTLDNLNSEEYYVNMAASWLLCEVFIHFEQETTAYFSKSKLNAFTINKAISKIRDSYRVSKASKVAVTKYKR